ncbi:MAG: protein-glutamate O-methyltransferase CheR [Candidatus Bathyarchaeota archaeon]|nr:protein-glutamate O-methyltransferase CheR [Candidatus Bathyarchaeum sp.]
MEQTVCSENFDDDTDFKKLKKVMHKGTGVNVEYYREAYLKRRLKVRLMVTKTNTYSEYIQYLKANPDEFSSLVNDLTINYTKFFRDPDVYVFLKEKLLPELILSPKKWVRIWSAGCATGEEPYSLAMLTQEVLKQSPKQCQVTIYASDLDKTALAKASSGTYNRRAVQGIDEELLSKYFELDGELYKVKPFVKKPIHFEDQDLMTPPIRRNLDLILCRNVMIYFSRDIQQQIYTNFYDSLRTGGYLITGKTEFVAGEANNKFVDVNPACRVYKKA